MNKRHTDPRITTIAILAAILALLGAASPTLAKPSPGSVPLILSVDAGADNAPISPDIYGMNRADEALLAELPIGVNRWGGTSASRYNYQTDITNLASDWYFENVPLGDGSNLPDESAANAFITMNNAHGAQTVLTVPTIGWVANDDPEACGASVSAYAAQGLQTGKDPARPDCGTGTLKTGGYVAGLDPMETSVPASPAFVEGWVSYLVSEFGGTAPKFYALDNEPDKWNDHHHDVHFGPMSYNATRDMAYSYGAAIKTANPDALVLGPVSHGWYGYFYSALDWSSDLGDRWQQIAPDRAMPEHEGKEFTAWYLEEMQDYEEDPAHPVRILDYLDLHFYTQIPGVALSSAGSATTKARRLRSTRSLWDETYKEFDDSSWIEGPVMLIPRMHEWVDESYPGTRLAISEYNWGGLEDINGALTQADVLGIFGRERVDLAALESPPSPEQPGAFAFRMYLNYDGSGGHFGDTTIRASSTDQARLAIYGSKDSVSGDLKLMVINKTSKPLSSPVNLSNFAASSCLYSYTYSPANLSAISSGWYPIDGDSFTYTFAGQSITLLVIPPAATACVIPASPTISPATSSPKNGSILTASTAKLGWKKLKGTVYYYDLEVADGLGNPLYSGHASNPYAMSPGYGRYQWRVRSALPNGLTAFGPWQTFEINRMAGPKDSTVLMASKVILKWKAVKNAAHHLKLWKDRGLPGEDLLIDQPVTGTSFKPLTLLAPGNYTWVISVNGTPMPEWDFTVVP